MTDQDPPIEPLRRVDPSEPDEQELRRLERIDPDAEEASETAAADEASRPASRLRDGLSAAITLAVLLSLSAIAAIGGLVAVSMNTVAPSAPVVDPVDAASPLTTIRVGESAQGPREGEREEEPRNERRPEPEPDGVVSIPAPVSPAPSSGGGGGGAKSEDDDGRRSGPKRIQGAWCDAPEGGSCDAVVGGAVLQPSSARKVEADDDDDVKDDETGPPGHAKH